MEHKETQPTDPLITILQQNELFDELFPILSKHKLKLEHLQKLITEDKINQFCHDLSLNIVQEIKFKSLMPKIYATMADQYCSRMYISDEVHDHIEITERIRQIIDTPEFQRLRELKQLGATYYVFPAAAHNRFEHSLGVMYLARKLMLSLKMNQPSLNISDHEIFLVSAAGLLHDLGHGPFSHVFDHEFVPFMNIENNGNKFRHEDMSVKLIQKLFKDNKIEISNNDISLICALVTPSSFKHIVQQYKDKKRHFLFEIIANESNGIDVDKWDYFLRDSKNLSLDISFKYTRLLTHCRVIDDHICFHDKTNYDVQILFNTRYDLFKRVYSHKTSKAVEYMICDILKFANPMFKITEKIENACDFMELTDNIIHRIQWRPIVANPSNNSDRIANENLQKAQALIHRIQTRNLYKCVGYILLESRRVAMEQMELKRSETMDCESDSGESEEKKDSHSLSVPEGSDMLSELSYTNQKIKYHYVEKKWRSELFEIISENNECDMCESDIICQLMSISYGSETQHPLKNVRFYSAKEPNVSRQIDMDQVTTLHDPSKFREVICRMYVKDAAMKECAEKGWKVFLRRKGLIDEAKKHKIISLGLSPKIIRVRKIDRRLGSAEPNSPIKRNLGDSIMECDTNASGNRNQTQTLYRLIGYDL